MSPGEPDRVPPGLPGTPASRIIVVTSVYNHATGLERSLRAVRSMLPQASIVVVDGAYAQFPHDTPWSTDGTLDVARQLADVVIPCPRDTSSHAPTTPASGRPGVSWGHLPWVDEPTKRSAYLVGDPGDLYLMLDSDEEPVEDHPGALRTALESFGGADADVFFRRTDLPDRPHPLYRVFRHEPGIHYRHTHYALWVGDRCRNWNRPRPMLAGFYVRHRIGEYSPERREARSTYYQWLKLAEAPYVYAIG